MILKSFHLLTTLAAMLLLLALAPAVDATEGKAELEEDYTRFLETLKWADLDGLKSTLMLYRNVKDINNRKDALEFLDSPEAGRLVPIRLKCNWGAASASRTKARRLRVAIGPTKTGAALVAVHVVKIPGVWFAAAADFAGSRPSRVDAPGEGEGVQGLLLG